MTLNTRQHCQTTNVYLPADESVAEAKAAVAFASATDIELEDRYYLQFSNNMMLHGRHLDKSVTRFHPRDL